jgi:hypothetical protein
MPRRVAIAVVCAAVLAVATTAAETMPFAPGGLVAPSGFIQVEGGCGRGFHPGPIGGCTRNLDASYPCYWVRTPGGLRLNCR